MEFLAIGVAVIVFGLVAYAIYNRFVNNNKKALDELKDKIDGQL